jgi:diguanylate cyclase (GGDEF)-like protein
MSGRFWYLASLVILGALALGVGLVWNSYARYQSDDTNLANIREYYSTLTLMSRISAERGPANAAMTQDSEAEPYRRDLKAARSGVDDALAELSASLGGTPRDDRSALLARLDALRERLQSARMRVDTVVGMPVDERSGAAVQGAIDAMFGVIDVGQLLVDDIAARTTRADPSLAHEVIVANLLTQMRDVAGRLGSQYIVPLQAQQVPTPARLTEITRLRVRVEQMHRTITGTITPLLANGDVASAWAQVNTSYFGNAFRMLDSLKMGDAAALPYPMTPAEFTARLVPDMNTLQVLRDTVLRTSFNDAVRARDAALRVMLISAGTTGLVILTIAAIIIGIQRFLFQPLLYIRDQIMALALNTPGEIKMPSAGSDEIREVLTALRLLRESQRARLAVERERDELNMRLKMLAETDPLTGLMNRRALEDALTRRRDQFTGFDGALGVILLDLDHFKQVNDVHGHIAGDMVLQEAARRVRTCVRSADLAARYGGEEFAVIVAQPNPELLQLIAEKIRSAIAATDFDAGPGLRLSVTASLGAAIGLDAEDGWTRILGTADQALYRAKDEGRNRVIFNRAAMRSRVAA